MTDSVAGRSFPARGPVVPRLCHGLDRESYGPHPRRPGRTGARVDRLRELERGDPTGQLDGARGPHGHRAEAGRLAGPHALRDGDYGITTGPYFAVTAFGADQGARQVGHGADREGLGAYGWFLSSRSSLRCSSSTKPEDALHLLDVRMSFSRSRARPPTPPPAMAAEQPVEQPLLERHADPHQGDVLAAPGHDPLAHPQPLVVSSRGRGPPAQHRDRQPASGRGPRRRWRAGPLPRPCCLPRTPPPRAPPSMTASRNGRGSASSSAGAGTGRASSSVVKRMLVGHTPHSGTAQPAIQRTCTTSPHGPPLPRRRDVRTSRLLPS